MPGVPWSLSRPLGACHPRLSMLGRLRLYLATFGRVFSFILLLVPGIAETLTSLPAAHPLADGPESPLVRSRPALAGRHLHRRLRPSSMGDPFASRGIGPAKGKKVAHPTSYPFAEHRIYELTCSSPPRADGRFAAIAVSGDCLLTLRSLPCCGHPGECNFRRPNGGF